MKKFLISFKIVVNLFIIIFCTISCGDSYMEKYDKVSINQNLEQIKQDWGKPDKEFFCKECDNMIVLKYKKDILGWNTYIFLFNNEDSLLVKKAIDD